MAVLIIIIIALFLSLVNTLDLGWVLVKLVDLPTLYYHLFIWWVLILRMGIWIWSRRWFFRALSLRYNRWINESDRYGPGSNGSGGGNTNGTRKYSTSTDASGTILERTMKSVASVHKNLSARKRAIGLMTRKTVDNFFRVIAKKGSLVSLRSGASSKGRPTISSLFSKVGFRIIRAVFTSKVKYLSRYRQLNAFLVHISNLRRHHGDVYVVKYLKASQLSLQKAIAGTPVSSLRQLEPALPLARVTANGIPKWIPIRDRRLITINGSPSVIRWYLTLLSVYRVIYIPGVLKLGTITDAMTVSIESVKRITGEILMILPGIFVPDSIGEQPDLAFRVSRPGLPPIEFLESASATSKVSWTGLLRDIHWLESHGKLDLVKSYLAHTGQVSFLRLISLLSSNLNALKGVFPDFTQESLKANKPIGRLALKMEAAGKVRVFAMVSFWDQIILRPLHKVIFAWLRKLPNDATFSQESSVRRCMEKSLLTGCSFGYDLSAATDRLPIYLQKEILNKLFPGLGDLWSQILIDRDYFLPESKQFPSATGNYRYAVGQPMGALSSWAMLAVTHHLVAQLSAFRARSRGIPDPYGFWSSSGWYQGYEVLGDDIVFFEEGVALEYLGIMSQLGVPINLSKSVVATNPTFEFAKVTGHRGNHVAAISWAMFMSQPTAMGRVGIAYSLMRKGICKSRIIRYLTALSRESRYTQGTPNLFFLGIGSMLAKAGHLRYSEFFHSILSYEDGKLTLLPVLNSSTSLSALQRTIAQVLKEATGKIPTVVSIPFAKDQTIVMHGESFALQKALAQTIKLFVHGRPTEIDGIRTKPLLPNKDAEVLARRMVQFMVGEYSPTQTHETWKVLESEGAFSLKPVVYHRLSPVGRIIHITYGFLYYQIYNTLVKHWSVLAQYPTLNLKKLPLEELMDLMAHIQRYREVLELPDRALEKLTGTGVNPDSLIDSPLSILVDVLKSESKIESVKTLIESTGAQVLKDALKSGYLYGFLTAFYDPDDNDHPDYRSPSGPIPLDVVRGLLAEFGQQFLDDHLPQWSKYGNCWKPTPETPPYTAWTYLQGQPEYLYSISMLEYLSPPLRELVPLPVDNSVFDRLDQKKTPWSL